MEITSERYAELVIAENGFHRLCEIIEDRKYCGLTVDEMLFLRDMFCGKANRAEDE